ncbi:MAG: hypothetical protein QOG30_478 [Acidimicrobiaceae bacterium]
MTIGRRRSLLALWCALVLGVAGMAAAAGPKTRRTATVAAGWNADHLAGVTTTSTPSTPAASTPADPVPTQVSVLGPSTTVTVPVVPTVPTTTLPPDLEPPVTLPPVSVVPGVPPLLSGIVVDATGQSLRGRCVDAMTGNEAMVPIDAGGYYHFDTLPEPLAAPEWTVTVVDCATRMYGQTSSLPVFVRSTPAVENLTLHEMPLLGGTILDEHDKPISGACVVEVSGPPGAPLLAPMRDDSSGRFGPADGAVPGTYVFQVRDDCGPRSYPSDGRTSMSVLVTSNNITFVPLTVIREMLLG